MWKTVPLSNVFHSLNAYLLPIQWHEPTCEGSPHIRESCFLSWHELLPVEFGLPVTTLVAASHFGWLFVAWRKAMKGSRAVATPARHAVSLEARFLDIRSIEAGRNFIVNKDRDHNKEQKISCKRRTREQREHKAEQTEHTGKTLKRKHWTTKTERTQRESKRNV